MTKDDINATTSQIIPETVEKPSQSMQDKIESQGEKLLSQACKAYRVDKKYLFVYSGYATNDMDRLEKVYTVNFKGKRGPEITYTPESKLLPAKIDAVCFLTVGGAKRWYPSKGKIKKLKTVYVDGISPKAEEEEEE